MNRHMQEQEQEHERRVSVLLEMIQERGGQLSISLRKGSSPRPKALRRRKWTLLKELVQPLRGGKACGRKTPADDCRGGGQVKGTEKGNSGWPKYFRDRSAEETPPGARGRRAFRRKPCLRCVCLR